MTSIEIIQRFSAKKAGRDRWIARCPNHDDRKPSLHLAAKKDKMLIKCFQCDTRDILDRVGLRLTDLFFHSRDFSSDALKAHLAKQRIEKCYEAEKRRQALSLWQESLNSPKPVRTQSRFERDIELAYSENSSASR